MTSSSLFFVRCVLWTMRPKRMACAESRSLTRRDLLDAAAPRIAEKGPAASSVEDIVVRAGYTRGAFYSNFGIKQERFIELLRVKHRDIQDNLETLLQDAAVSSELFNSSSLCCMHAAIRATSTKSFGPRPACRQGAMCPCASMWRPCVLNDAT
ncbi:TetR/AcrR family transcriptional regulator [Burkholderia contaminans]|uniref:TetR/AcrR family transcriptional regulator n=1 Tax=Burkholderia contaminans TaxID=488447 RepID=A0A3N8NTW3_9BURK|nr:TetR/AcrR family transcriptional regulator [Burkholderia contaminans]RQT02761.1 TetR/AcrR family transcriptional regulator [Burkholderia contaminans]